MTNSQLAWSFLVEPRRAFAALRERPYFWFPLLAIVVTNTVLSLWYFSVVDFAWLSAHLAQGLEGDPTSAERAQTTELMSKSVLMWVTVASAVFGIPLLRVLESAYYALVGKAADISLSFRHWLSLACWTAWPYIITTLVMVAPLLLHRNGQLGQDELSLMSLNELIFHVPKENRWHTLLSTLTILHPWAWWLTVLGVRQWTSRSLAFSVLVAMLPVIAFYGVWLVVILTSP